MTGAGTIYALVYMLLLVSLPLSLTVDGLNPANAGLIMTVATVTLVLARPALRTRPLAALSPGAAFTAGYLLLAAGLAGYTFAHTLPALLAPTALYSLGNLLLMGRALAVVSELAPPGATARYLAVYGLSWGFATMLAPLLSTWLIGAFGPGTLWAAMATLCLVMAVAQPRLLPRIADEYADAAVTVADVEGEAKAAAAAITAADTEAVANAYFEFSAADGAATCADGPAVTTSPAHASVLVKANDGRI
jgi:MFS family permease